MLVKNERNLVELIRGYFGKPYKLEDVDWLGIFNASKKHNVTTIFYEAIKERNDVPEKVLYLAKQQTLALINQQIKQEYFTEEVMKKLNEKGIKHVALKGYVMRRYYPRPDLRSSCDSDILYDETRTEDIAPIMQGFGFHLDHEWMNGVVRIEMHSELFGYHELNYKYYRSVWDKLINDGGARYKFTDEDFYVYFIAHASKHFSSAGFGIRTIMDIFVFNKENKNLNKDYIYGELDKMGLKKFTLCLERVANIWFDDEKTDEEIALIEEYVLKSGAYGIKEHGTVMSASNKKKSAKGTKIRYMFRVVFPSYKKMRISYTVLKKAPILLPFVWVYRWFKVLFTKRKNISKVSKSASIINGENSARTKKMLEITDFPDYNL